MLTFRQRIRLGSDYKSILRRGQRYYTDSSILFVKKNSDTTLASRVGFITSKKVGNAVIRNRLRRKFREYVRINITRFQPGFDLVFVISKNAAEKDTYQLIQEIKKQLQRSGVVLD